MANIRFLSGVCAECLQECVPIQLLSRNPHSLLLLGATLRFSVAEAFAIGAPLLPPRKGWLFSVKEASVTGQTLSRCRKGGSRLPGEEGMGGSE